MKFTTTSLAGVVRVDIEPIADERGMFARTYCNDEFSAAGISFEVAQMNLSRNSKKHTLRGMHFQAPPFAEAKLVRVVAGALYDVVIDLRQDSPSYGHWIGETLTADAGEALFIPEGCAHGFLTLADCTDILYLMGSAYVAGHGKGVRWNDPAFGIKWPGSPAVIDAKDREWPDFGI